MVYFTPEKWIRHRSIILIVCVAVSLIAGFIPVHSSFGIQSTLTLLPFFVLGYYSTSINVRSYINKIPLFFAIGILMAAFCFFYFVMNINLDEIYGCWPYWTYDKKELILIRLVARSLFLPTSVIIGIIVLKIMPTNKTLAKWGKATLFIFIYHSFAVRELLVPLINKGFLPHNEWLLFAYTIIIFLGLLFLSHSYLLNFLFNPISTIFVSKIKKDSTHTKE